MEGLLSVMQVLFSSLFLVQTIAAVGVDPVEFLLSKDSPKNKSQVPLPANFAYSGDPKTDCCSLVLFVTVKDWSPHVDPDDYEDSGEEPPEDKVPQIEHGVVNFNLSHPQIRNGDNIFSMNYVKNDIGQVKERFIIKFNNCGSITHKIFGIYASTDIVNTKDIKIEIIDGKDIGIDCSTNTTTPVTEPPAIGNSIPTIVVAVLGWFVAIIATVAFVICYKKYNELKKAQTNAGEPAEMVPMGTPERAFAGAGAVNVEELVPMGQITKGGPRSIPLGGKSKSENNVLCGPITKDNLPLFITGAVAVIFLIIGLSATVKYCIANDTPN